VRSAVSAVAKTLVFTVFVPGTVAGYVPWRLRSDAAAPVTGAEEWAAITVIAVGIAIYLYTAFWGFVVIGGGTPAPIAPTKILVIKGLHRFVRNPMYIGVALVIGGLAWLFHSLHIAIYMVCMLLVANVFVLSYEEPTLHRQFGEGIRSLSRIGAALDPEIQTVGSGNRVRCARVLLSTRTCGVTRTYHLVAAVVALAFIPCSNCLASEHVVRVHIVDAKTGNRIPRGSLEMRWGKRPDQVLREKIDPDGAVTFLLNDPLPTRVEIQLGKSMGYWYSCSPGSYDAKDVLQRGISEQTNPWPTTKFAIISDSFHPKPAEIYFFACHIPFGEFLKEWFKGFK
jgi:protein-S-isoprenylcysteine O-methyltransferase Ste14